MSKPIEWTIPGPEGRARLHATLERKLDTGSWQSYEVRLATPADMTAALAAMPAEEREKVLREFDVGTGDVFAQLAMVRDQLSDMASRFDLLSDQRDAAEREVQRLAREVAVLCDRAEKAERALVGVTVQHSRELKELERLIDDERSRADQAERERDSMGAEFGCCPGEIPDDGEIARVVRERGEFRDRAEKAERERDGARAELSRLREQKPLGYSYTDAVTLFRRDPSASWTCDELQRVHGPDASCRFVEYEHRVQFTGASGYYSGPYTPTGAEAKSTTWRRVDAKPDAHQPPRSYPLAEGSRWDGDDIVENDGTRLSYRRSFVAVTQQYDGLAVKVEARARNLAALLAKGGLL